MHDNEVKFPPYESGIEEITAEFLRLEAELSKTRPPELPAWMFERSGRYGQLVARVLRALFEPMQHCLPSMVTLGEPPSFKIPNRGWFGADAFGKEKVVDLRDVTERESAFHRHIAALERNCAFFAARCTAAMRGDQNTHTIDMSLDGLGQGGWKTVLTFDRDKKNYAAPQWVHRAEAEKRLGAIRSNVRAEYEERIRERDELLDRKRHKIDDLCAKLAEREKVMAELRKKLETAEASERAMRETWQPIEDARNAERTKTARQYDSMLKELRDKVNDLSPLMGRVEDAKRQLVEANRQITEFRQTLDGHDAGTQWQYPVERLKRLIREYEDTKARESLMKETLAATDYMRGALAKHPGVSGSTFRERFDSLLQYVDAFKRLCDLPTQGFGESHFLARLYTLTNTSVGLSLDEVVTEHRKATEHRLTRGFFKLLGLPEYEGTIADAVTLAKAQWQADGVNEVSYLLPDDEPFRPLRGTTTRKPRQTVTADLKYSIALTPSCRCPGANTTAVEGQNALVYLCPCCDGLRLDDPR